jgi:YVTN family beta-propeller protein
MVLGIEVLLISAIILLYNAAAETQGTMVNQRNLLGLPNIPNIKVGHFPDGIAIDPDTNHIYVANYRSNTVSVIDANTMNVTSIRVGHPYSRERGGYTTGGGLESIDVDPNTDELYTVNISENFSVIHDNAVLSRSPFPLVNATVLGVSVDPSDDVYLYIAHQDKVVNGTSTSFKNIISQIPKHVPQMARYVGDHIYLKEREDLVSFKSITLQSPTYNPIDPTAQDPTAEGGKSYLIYVKSGTNDTSVISIKEVSAYGSFTVKSIPIAGSK